jgi:DNA polymerase II small subunit
METGEIVQMFAESDFGIDPLALDLLKTSSPELIHNVLKSIDSSVMVVGIEHIKHLVKKPNPETVAAPKTIPQKPDIIPSKVKPNGNPVTILKDITNQSTCIGEYTEFVNYFTDRYNSLRELLRKRMSARYIKDIKKWNLDTREPLSIIGMVLDIRTSAKGHKLIEVEDTTGTIPVLIHKEKDKELFELAKRIILDEVIGVTGTLSSDSSLMFANRIMFPDIPNFQEKTLDRKKPEGKAVFISDIHVGSKTFLEDSWLKFVEWLGDDINYLVIAGDVVDGIGVFPNQDKELAISDIYEQYEKAAEYLNAVPGHIRIIVSPGNHDAVRQAEPQPRFPEKITKLFRNDIIFVGNPAMVDIGVKVLIYHGRSMDDIIASIPGFSYGDPSKPMSEMLKLRHLSPIYGGRVSIAPELKDHFVIDTIPDILHCGHVHTVGVSRYKEVLTINSGTWQSQTEFQKKMNLQPTPAKATVVNLSSMEYSIMDFN